MDETIRIGSGLTHDHVCPSCVYHDCDMPRCPARALYDAWHRWDGRGDGPGVLGSSNWKNAKGAK